MNGIKNWIIFAITLLLMTNGVVCAVLADHGEYRNKKWYQKTFDWDDDDDDHERGRNRRQYQKRLRNDSEHDEKEYLTPVNNQTYIDECGACHFAYQPELLPSASWLKILNQLDDHFGEEIEADPDTIKTILDYLKTNGAENSSAKRSKKIMRNLGNQVPMRITDIPYIREKHHELDPAIFTRESVGSLANCIACHITAEKGIYDDDDVKIPK
jgi:hypothetical protein